MFFRTQLKSVGVGGAVDMQGRRLAFIGYLPCKAGDWVFTDGSVIFGNSKPKGAPAIFNAEPSGIPVLSDDLRGYFTTSGKFKKYRIKGDEWITNGEKKYSHDNGEENIIDAEIARDNDGKEIGIYTVIKKIENIDAPPDNDTFDELCTYEYSNLSTGDWKIYNGSMLNDSDFCSDDGKISRQLTIIIKKDDKEIHKINVYDDYLQEYEEDTKKDHYFDGQEDFTNIYPDNITLEEHYGTRAQLVNFKMFPDGTWTMILGVQVVFRGKYYSAKGGQVIYDGEYYDTSKGIEWTAFHTRIRLFKTNLDGTWLIIGRSKCTFARPYGDDAKPYYAGQTAYADVYPFPIQDGFYARIRPVFPTNYISPRHILSTVYSATTGDIADFSNIASSTDAHKWNMSLAPLKGGGYLFGVRKDTAREVGGFLYKVDRDGTVEQVGAGLKNFRLRELKKISKAKK